MADYYAATLVMGAPKDKLPKPVLELIEAAFGADLANDLTGGSFDDENVKPDEAPTRSVLELYEARYGIYNFSEAGDESYDLLATLQEYGVAYEASDEGQYENAGERTWWKPGMDMPRSTGNDQSGPVLSKGMWEEAKKERANDPGDGNAALVRFVDWYFAGPWD